MAGGRALASGRLMQVEGAPRYWHASSQLIQSMLANPQMPKNPPACSTFSAANPAEEQGYRFNTGH